MIVREASAESKQPKVQREAENKIEKKKLGRSLKHSDLCEALWNGSDGIASKDDLERSIRAADVTMLPKSVPDELVAIAVITGGKYDSVSDYVLYRGKAHFNTMMRMYRQKLEAVFDRIRSLDKD